MAFTSTQAGASPDYTKYLYGELVKDDRIGDPDLLDFALAPVDGSFVKLNRGAYITVSNSTYGTWFTGYVTNDPELEYFGEAGRVGAWGFKYEATSDDYLLNLKPVGLMPPFINTNQGTILKSIINRLAPGVFDTSAIQNGLTVTRYVVDPNKHFSDILKEFTDSSNYRWRAINKALTYEPQSTTPAAIAVDGNSKHFTPANLTIKGTNDQIANDVIVLGDIEPQNYINEYYVGDGVTAQFPLISSVFGVDRAVLLDDDFGGSQIDTQKWTVTDTVNNWIQVFNGFLNVIGGDNNTTYSAHLDSAQLIPLEGCIRITHGEWDFVDTGTSATVQGVIGGLWSGAPQGSVSDSTLFPGCLYGFRLFRNGAGSASLCTIVNGVTNLVNTFNIDYTKRYIIRTIVQVSDTKRLPASYGYLDANGNVGQFSGTLLSSTVNLATYISEIDPTNANITRSFSFFDSFVAAGNSAFIYTPVAANDLHCTVTGITVSVPMQVTLSQKFAGTTFVSGAQYAVNQYVRPTVANGFIFKVTTAGTSGTEPVWPVTANQTVTSGSVTFIALVDDYQKQIVGPNEIDSLDGMAPIATIVDANNGTQTRSTFLGSSQYNPGQANLTFFKDTANQVTTVPAKGDLLHLTYRRPGAAIARVQNLTSIATEAAAWGDDGHRSLTKNDISPLPKTSIECELAAAAMLQDFAVQHYEGTYTMSSGSWFTGEPISGTILKFQNLPASFPASLKAEVITEVKTTWQNQTPEVFQHEISFGKIDHLKQFVADNAIFGDTPQDVFTPQDTAEIPNFIDVNDIGNTYMPDVTAPSLVSFDPSNLNFNTNLAPKLSPNLLLWPEDFSNAVWVKSAGVTVTANSVANPVDGTLTADAVSYPAKGVNAAVWLNQDVTSRVAPGPASQSFTFSVWLKVPSGTQNVEIVFSDESTLSPVTTCPVTTSWQRFTVSGTFGSGAANHLDVQIRSPFAPSEPVFTLHVWGAQIETGTAATAYVSATSAQAAIGAFEVRYTDESWGADDAKNLVTRTSGSAQTFSVSRNARGKICFVKAYDFRNKILWAEDFTQSAWVKTNATAANSTAVNPDGNSSQISTVNFTAGSNSFVVQTSGVAISGAQAVASVSVKGPAGKSLSLRLQQSLSPFTQLATLTITLNGQWQRFSVSYNGATQTGLYNLQIVNTSGAALSGVQITRASLEVNTSSETVYCKTNGSVYGVMSRFAAGLHVAYPLIPPAPTGTVDFTDVTAPVVSVVLPTTLVDVWGVEVRASDNSTVLYHADLTDASFNPQVTVSGNNTRSLSYFLYTYNLLGEYSSSFHLTATIPTPSVSGVSVVDATKSVVWTPSASTSGVKIEIDDTSNAFGHIVLTDANNTGTAELLSDQDFFKQRWIRVTPFDALGSGTAVVVSHIYSPAGVTEFNANEVASIPVPATPTTDPTIPTPLSDYPKQVIDKSWGNRRINMGNY